MKRLTPAEIDFTWEGHKAALWWLSIIYRKPSQFTEEIAVLTNFKKTFQSLIIYIHFIPYMTVIFIFFRIIFFQFGYEAPWGNPLSTISLSIFLAVASGMTTGILICIAELIYRGITIAVVMWLVSNISFGLGVGTLVASITLVTKGVNYSTVEKIAIASIFAFILAFVRGISAKVDSSAKRTSITEGIFFGIGGGAVFLLSFDITIRTSEILLIGAVSGLIGWIAYTRSYYLPLHLLLVWPSSNWQLFEYHPVKWDSLCLVRFYGLQKMLVSYAQNKPQAGKDEIERLIDSYPSQRMEALKAKVVLLAREASNIDGLEQLERIVLELPEGKKEFLANMPRLKELLQYIIHRQKQLNGMSRPILREPHALLLQKEIQAFQNTVAGFHEPLNSEFRRAADKWLKIAADQVLEIKAINQKAPVQQVFRAGDPVEQDNEAFVPRHHVIGNLEKQLMLSTGCPGIVLYARRRVGKSTLLKNLIPFLQADKVCMLNLSMQNPALFSSLDSWMQHIAEQVTVLMPKDFQGVNGDLSNLAEFFKFLSSCNDKLREDKSRLLLAIDEYENIDRKIGEGVFPLDLLDTIRESIQTHRQITWIFAGSHEITELKNAPWTSYFVSVQTVEVPMFSLKETRTLLTEPLRNSTLWQTADENSQPPLIAASFWGEDGIEKIHYTTGGWPHLVQLVCEKIVDIISDRPETIVTTEIMEMALQSSVVSGHNVLFELLKRESTLEGEWEYLCGFKESEDQKPPEDNAIRLSLQRRLLVEEVDGKWCLRVPLMLRWLRERG